MTREEARKKAIELVKKMTIEEMTTQLRFDSEAIERLNIPDYNWWGEALHGLARAGVATVFPQAIAMAATFDEEIVKNVGDIVSTEARAKYNANHTLGDNGIYKGLTLWSPNVNIFRDPRWGRGHETYGEDPYLTSRLGVAYIKGLQGDGETLKTAACAKHFAVHSGPEAERHRFNAIVSKKDLRETYLPAFKACVEEAKVEAVMGAYNRTNGEPCCANTELMENILRKEWKFEGHYVSDCWAIKDFHENHKVTNNPRQSAALALKKGCDVNCGTTYLCMLQAYKEKLITKEEIETAAVRLYTTRFLLGMFDGSEYDAISYSEVEKREHLDYSRKVAEKSMVLLKNIGILPLNKETLKSIAVIGPNANSRSSLIGNYHGTASRYWTVSEGIQDYLRNENIRIYYSEGCDISKESIEPLAKPGDRIAEAVTIANLSDVVILCLGLDETLEGEEGDTGNSYTSGDKETLNLPESQLRLAKALEKTGTPIILVNMTGSAVELSFAKENESYKAIIQSWYPGAEGGRALANILFGEVSPSGKLPITFYNSLEELPAFTDYTMEKRTYRYMEKRAQFPFGYGLTYGHVMVVTAQIEGSDDLEEQVKKKSLSETFYKLKVIVKNDSNFDVEEVVQVYIKDLKSKYAVKNFSLSAFKRVALRAGETKEMVLHIPSESFMVYDYEGNQIMDSDKFEIYVGTSQPDAESIMLTKSCPKKIELG